MNIIKNNPFRILGLPANSSEREIQKNISTLKKYAEIEKTKEFDYDFAFLGDFLRTIEDVEKAASRIEQLPKKLHNALFWFINSSKFDEIAINYLKDNNTDKAIEIWEKTLKDEITEKNYSSYANLSTLLIGLAFVKGRKSKDASTDSLNSVEVTVSTEIIFSDNLDWFDDDEIEKENIKKDLLKRGIELKGNFLNSKYVQNFILDITKNGNITNVDNFNSEFTTEILQLVNPHIENKDLTIQELVSFFSEFSANIQKSITSKFSETYIFNVERNIENTVKKRNETPIEAEIYGETLYKDTKKDIVELKQIFGEDNIQFQMIANKLANEILQCSIDFFNFYSDDRIGFDPGDDALKVARYANDIGATGQVKNRIEEALQTLNNIKLQDCFQILLVLEHIKKTYNEVAEQSYDVFSNSRMGINEEKVKEVINSAVTIDIVKKIAESDNIELINEFYDLIKFINKRLNYNYISEIKLVLKNNLPKGNSIKNELIEEFEEIEKEKRRREEQRRIEEIEEEKKRKEKLLLQERVEIKKREEQEKIEQEKLRKRKERDNNPFFVFLSKLGEFYDTHYWIVIVLSIPVFFIVLIYMGIKNENKKFKAKIDSLPEGTMYLVLTMLFIIDILLQFFVF